MSEYIAQHLHNDDDEYLPSAGTYAGQPVGKQEMFAGPEIHQARESQLFHYIVSVLLDRSAIKKNEIESFALEIATICKTNRDVATHSSAWSMIESGVKNNPIHAQELEHHLRSTIDASGIKDLVLQWIKGFFPNETYRMLEVTWIGSKKKSGIRL